MMKGALNKLGEIRGGELGEVWGNEEREVGQLKGNVWWAGEGK